jgi:hypothetical protein
VYVLKQALIAHSSASCRPSFAQAKATSANSSQLSKLLQTPCARQPRKRHILCLLFFFVTFFCSLFYFFAQGSRGEGLYVLRVLRCVVFEDFCVCLKMPDEAKIHCVLQSYVLQSSAIYFCKATASRGIIFMNIYIYCSSADLRGFLCYVVQRQSDAAERPIFPGFDGADVGPLRQQVQELSKYDVSVFASVSVYVSVARARSLPLSLSVPLSLYIPSCVCHIFLLHLVTSSCCTLSHLLVAPSATTCRSVCANP